MKIKAFTLVELLIAVAIIAIVAALAVASYRHYLLQGSRTDAMRTLLAIQLAEEKYRMNNTNYGTLAQVWNGVTATEGGHYTLSISNVSGTTFTVTATATGSQSGDAEGGTSCTNLILAYANGTTSRTPAVCWMDY